MNILRPFLAIAEPIQIQGDIEIYTHNISLYFNWSDVNALIFKADHIEIQRLNELWKSTCFEAFLQTENSENYYELNCSSAGAWNAYHFTSYREPQPPQETNDLVLRQFSRNSNGIETHWKIQGHLLQINTKGANWRVSLNAVIELIDGTKKYFAIDHLENRPDFHLSRSFKLRKRTL